jgi:plastocyanin
MADNSFGTSQLTVAAGTPITLTVNNGGKNMHNFDLQGVAKTPLQPSGQSQVVTFTVAPGSYTFVCDVHPKDMIGTLVAQ